MAIATTPQRTKELSVRKGAANSSAPILHLHPPSLFLPVNYLLQKTMCNHLKKAIQVTVSPTDDGGWLAKAANILTYGYGDTPLEAVADFASMLDDLYMELSTTESVLAPHLKKDLDYLRTLFAEA